MQNQTNPTVTPSPWLSVALIASVMAMGACGGDNGTTPSTVGSVQVSVTTSGSDLDPDGYTVLLDGGSVQPIGLDGSVSFSGLEPGDYELSLGGVATNCSVSGENPRTLTVAAGQTAQTIFEVTCGLIVGDLEVITVTTGDDIDPDGYTFSIDGGAGQAIGVNDAVLIQVPPGGRSVELLGVADNCTVTGDNPRTVAVSASTASQTNFVVSCTSNTGSLVVTTTTSGVNVDPDGYTALVDGANGQPVPNDGSVTFLSVEPGVREVSLDGLAANCSVSGDNPRSVTVQADAIASTTFNVTCVPIVTDLNVITITTGEDLDSNGYTFTVDGVNPQVIGVNDSVTVGVAAGDRSIQLTSVANNCTVAGSNPRVVTVPTSGSARTEFIVSCTSVTGSLVATTTTTGVDLDPDGYTVVVDGAIFEPIGASATVSINDVPIGDRSVELTGLANNCAVSGQNPRTVTVPNNAAVQTDFSITCVPITGTVEVTTATTGTDLDMSGYTVRVDGVPDEAIGINETIAVTGVIWGDKNVELLNLDSNCSVTGENPRTVTVPQEATVATTFDVTCVALTGNLMITASTTGGDQDPDGYMVSVDGGPAEALPTNGSFTFLDVAAGDRNVLLTDIAPNCVVTGDNPATVTVPSSATGTHTFDITCTAVVGDVDVTTSTTGAELDPDGYTVTVEGQSPVAIGINQTITVSDVSIGDKTVELTGVAANCTVAGQNPRTVTVTEGGTVSTTFDVSCLQSLDNQIVFDTDRDGGDTEIYVMDPDGTGLVRLTNSAGRDAEPYASFDGTKIAFVSDRNGDNEIYVMNADGSSQTRLTTNGANDREPAWSPDGTKIAFTSDRSGEDDVWVMDADGSNPTRLTTAAGRDGLAAWSPDGTEIVFTSFRDGDGDIFVMDADGTNETPLTFNTDRDFAAAFSPDGSQIAFTTDRDGDREIYLMNANGSGQANLTNFGAANDLAPQWSPDGSQIAFASSRDGNSEVYVMSSDGTGLQVNITMNAATDFEVSWSP